ncbi:MAG: hypothetical protein IPG96_16250 [Proteobacteria bacterium]|nr:hypothetical protein [Pseudomonadota bacterium]
MLYGQTIAPSLFYVGSSYNGTTWVGDAGPTLALAGTGAAPTIVDAPTEAVAAEDAGVLCNYGAGKYFSSSPDTTAGDVTTEDMIFELWLKSGPNALDFAIGKRGTTTQGWMLYSASTSAKLSLKYSATTVVSSWSIAAATWTHLVVGVDRSSSTGVYCAKDGVLQGTSFDPTALTTLTSSTATFVGAVNSSGPSCASSIALAAMWKANGWLDASDKPALAAWALDRYNTAIGV